MGCVIRAAHEGDAADVSLVILRALRETNAKDYSQEIIERLVKSFSPADVLKLIGKRKVFVAVMGDRIVGTASLDGKVVRTVFVAPDVQGRGVGRLLMAEVERAAREMGVEALAVPSSVTAEHFYSKLGFKAVRDSYHDEERTIIMERSLAPLQVGFGSNSGIATSRRSTMKLRSSVNPDDLAAVRAWFDILSKHCRAVDYEAARPIFADDMIAFGTFTDFMHGRELAEQKQWRNVWGTIRNFRFDLDKVEAIVSADRLTAVGMGVWQSDGFHPNGDPFDRPGRTTVVLGRKAVGDPFVATHTHMSLFRGTPERSFGKFG